MFNNYIFIYNYFLKYTILNTIFNTEKESRRFTIRNENSTNHI